MIKDEIEKHLGIENLKDYLIAEIIKGKENGKVIADDTIKEVLQKINITNESGDSDDIKLHKIIGVIIVFRERFFRIKPIDFTFYRNQSKPLRPFAQQTDEEEINNIADYILKTTNEESFTNFFHKASTTLKFENIQKESENFYKVHYLELFLIEFCNNLKEIDVLKEITWDVNNFEQGIIKLIENIHLDKINQIEEKQNEIKLIELNFEHEKNDLLNRINDLESENRKNEITNQYVENYIKTYPTYDIKTDFGDNLPFLLNLYNYLKAHRLTLHSWSDFFMRFAEKSDEIIYLDQNQTLRFIGRIFYNLKYFIIPHHKNNYEAYLRRKFRIDNGPLSKTFYTNYLGHEYDETLYTYIPEIDNFFEKQKEIFLDSN